VEVKGGGDGVLKNRERIGHCSDLLGV
jgi:hypothetical protein